MLHFISLVLLVVCLLLLPLSFLALLLGLPFFFVDEPTIETDRFVMHLIPPGIIGLVISCFGFWTSLILFVLGV